MEERRRFVRLHSWLTASYQVVGESRPLKSVTRNTGGGGVGFLTKSRLASGTLLEITLVFPDQGRTIRFTGEVCWSGPLLLQGASPNPPRAFETGVRFRRIVEADRDFLLQYSSAPNPAS